MSGRIDLSMVPFSLQTSVGKGFLLENVIMSCKFERIENMLWVAADGDPEQSFSFSFSSGHRYVINRQAWRQSGWGRRLHCSVWTGWGKRTPRNKAAEHREHRRKHGEVLLNARTVSASHDVNMLETDTMLWLYLMSLNCTLKNDENGQLCYIFFIMKRRKKPQFLIKRKKGAAWKLMGGWGSRRS